MLAQLERMEALDPFCAQAATAKIRTGADDGRLPHCHGAAGRVRSAIRASRRRSAGHSRRMRKHPEHVERTLQSGPNNFLP